MRHTMDDGSALEVESTGRWEPFYGSSKEVIRYRIIDASGSVLAEGEDLWASPMETEPEEWLGSLASFLGADAEMFEMGPDGSWGERYPGSADPPDPEEYIFGEEVARWADEHSDELAMLREERGEG